MQPHDARDSWFEEHKLIEINIKKFEAQFGDNDNIMVLIEADEITSPVDMEISVDTENGIEVINPFENGIPKDPDKPEEIRQLV